MQGKSTLANWLVGRERSLTGPEPGLTRDAITTEFTWEGRSVQLVDSAGWVRAAKLVDDGCGCGPYLDFALPEIPHSPPRHSLCEIRIGFEHTNNKEVF